MDLKGKTLDAITYDLLERNFQMLDDNNRILKDKCDLLEDANTKIRRGHISAIN